MEVDAKVVLLGTSMVGKTSIVTRATSGGFEADQQPTVGACYSTKTIEVDQIQVNLQIWDTAGQERFRSLAPMYYHNANVALLVFDLTDRNSLREVQRWSDELVQHMEQGQLKYVVGNKMDLVQERVVTEPQGQAMADEVQAFYFETSALDGKGIEELFTHVADAVVHSEQVMRNKRPVVPVLAEDAPSASRKKRECC